VLVQALSYLCVCSVCVCGCVCMWCVCVCVCVRVCVCVTCTGHLHYTMITDDSEIVYKRLVLETGANRQHALLIEVNHNKVN
jgi:hypothetical protein